MGAKFSPSSEKGKPIVRWGHKATDPLQGWLGYRNFHPSLGGSNVITSYSIHYTKLYEVAIDGDMVYVANGRDGLMVVDVSNPRKPKIVSNLKTEGQAIWLTIKGSRLYLADMASGFQVIDISDPKHLV